MKTTIKVQESVTRNFKRVMVKVFTSAIGLFLTISTVLSQNLLEQLPQTIGPLYTIHLMTDSANENGAMLAVATIRFTNYSPADAISHFTIEQTAEKPLNIEPWMTDSRNFEQSISIADEKESPLALEEWMTNELNFGTSLTTFTDETEKPMPIESWMTDESFWVN